MVDWSFQLNKAAQNHLSHALGYVTYLHTDQQKHPSTHCTRSTAGVLLPIITLLQTMWYNATAVEWTPLRRVFSDTTRCNCITITITRNEDCASLCIWQLCVLFYRMPFDFTLELHIRIASARLPKASNERHRLHT